MQIRLLKLLLQACYSMHVEITGQLFTFLPLGPVNWTQAINLVIMWLPLLSHFTRPHKEHCKNQQW